MVVIYNNEKVDNTLRESNFVKKGEAPESFVNIVFESGDYLTVVGDDSELEHLAEVLTLESISVNLDDFECLDYFENMTIDDVIMMINDAASAGN